MLERGHTVLALLWKFWGFTKSQHAKRCIAGKTGALCWYARDVPILMNDTWTGMTRVMTVDHVFRCLLPVIYTCTCTCYPWVHLVSPLLFWGGGGPKRFLGYTNHSQMGRQFPNIYMYTDINIIIIIMFLFVFENCVEAILLPTQPHFCFN